MGRLIYVPYRVEEEEGAAGPNMRCDSRLSFLFLSPPRWSSLSLLLLQTPLPSRVSPLPANSLTGALPSPRVTVGEGKSVLPRRSESGKGTAVRLCGSFGSFSCTVLPIMTRVFPQVTSFVVSIFFSQAISFVGWQHCSCTPLCRNVGGFL